MTIRTIKNVVEIIGRISVSGKKLCFALHQRMQFFFHIGKGRGISEKHFFCLTDAKGGNGIGKFSVFRYCRIYFFFSSLQNATVFKLNLLIFTVNLFVNILFVHQLPKISFSNLLKS